jgi:hypothetical protein
VAPEGPTVNNVAGRPARNSPEGADFIDYGLRIGMAPIALVDQRKGRSSMNHTFVPRGPGGADFRNPEGADFIDYELRITDCR